MEKVVCDASVIVKWYIEEKYSANALKLRDKYINGEIRIIAPDLMPFEVLNALRYSNLFKEDELKAVARSLSYYGIEMHSLRNKLAEKTIEIALRSDITIYDASYVALAITHNTKLYTADSKLIEKLGKKYEKIVIHISKYN